jgi:hypothetical protein
MDLPLAVPFVKLRAEFFRNLLVLLCYKLDTLS